jgi:hypothetical protein
MSRGVPDRPVYAADRLSQRVGTATATVVAARRRTAAGHRRGTFGQPRVPGGGQRSEIDLVAWLLSLPWPWPAGRVTAHQDGPWLAGRTPVQPQVTAV